MIIMNIYFDIRLLINDSWPLGCYFSVSMFPCFWWKYSWNSILHNDYILTLIWSCIQLFNKNVSLLPLLWTITYHKSYHIVLFLHYRLSLLYLWNNVAEFFYCAYSIKSIFILWMYLQVKFSAKSFFFKNMHFLLKQNFSLVEFEGVYFSSAWPSWPLRAKIFSPKDFSL